MAFICLTGAEVSPSCPLRGIPSVATADWLGPDYDPPLSVGDGGANLRSCCS